MKLLKFGGKSLDDGQGITQVLSIITDNYAQGEAPVVVVSARGATTDTLLELIAQAREGKPYEDALTRFWVYQQGNTSLHFERERELLSRLLLGISLLGECSPQVEDEIISLGEVISSQFVAYQLQQRGLPAIALDSGDFLVTDSQFGSASVDLERSEARCRSRFADLPKDSLPIVTGFIARDAQGRRTTLGRNGSNYSAALLANFLGASLLENYTHIDGIYTADPALVPEARKIEELSYAEAAELSQFGAEILHTKTIEPLQAKRIPLRVLSTFDYGDAHNGTLISPYARRDKVRALASLPKQALIHFEGRNMLGRPGIDARIFKAFDSVGVSAGMVSQGSTERGIAIVVKESDADRAIEALRGEFRQDLSEGLITEIYAVRQMVIVALIGLSLREFDRPYRALVRNHILPLLLNNSIPDNTVCLLIDERNRRKALNVIHGELFERPKRIHLAIIGTGNVGGELIDQLIRQRGQLCQQKNIDLRIFAIANSRQLLIDREGIGEGWREALQHKPYHGDLPEDLVFFGKELALENMILVDNTTSKHIAQRYPYFAEGGFDIVSSNKKANIAPYDQYLHLRQVLRDFRRSYRYETNVGAGLPLIDNLKLLHLAGERITRIHGLFSGSLSYIFNRLSEAPELSFRQIVEESASLGLTEPDPREDLSGEDVVRKVLILVRELDVPAELTDVQWDNPVPEGLRSLSLQDFWARFDELEETIKSLRSACAPDEVLRYVGDIRWDGQLQQATPSAGLRRVKKSSPLGRVSGADSCFEIYTESYGSQPIVIQGAGAGAVVTARGVFGDVLRLAEGYDY